MDGVGSAREVDRLCYSHDAYRWLRGGVSVNHHTLSDFRVGQQAALDDLLTQSITALLRRGIVTMARVAHDGTRVRGSAGAGSFRRGDTLQACQRQARQQVERTQKQADPARPDARRGRATPRGGGSVGARGRGAGAVARHSSDQRPAAEAQARDGGPGVHDRSRCPGHEDGRRRLSPRVQRPPGDRCRQPHHCGCPLVTNVAVIKGSSALWWMRSNADSGAPSRDVLDGGFATKADIIRSRVRSARSPMRRPRIAGAFSAR